MNLVLFEEPFERARLPADDPRARHLRDVVGVSAGSAVSVGFVGGPRARATVSELGGDGSVALEVEATEPVEPLMPLMLLLGMPRPHTARRVLSEAASMGAAALHFVPGERGEASYASSRLWQTREWRERLRLGAEQAFSTRLPEVAHHPDLQSALSAIFDPDAERVALDNYETEGALGEVLSPEAASAVFAIGAERGWSNAERDVFRRNGWRFGHLGPRVLRTETACSATVAVAATRLKRWNGPTRTSLFDAR